MEMITEILSKNGLVFAFVVVGVVMWVSYQLSDRLSAGRLHGSAVAIIIGLVLAWLGGLATGGSKGLADVPLFAGIGLMGGAMLRDLAIVSTAYGVDIREIRKAGAAGVVSLALGIFVSFAVGALVAAAFGYTDAVSMATIGGGAATYIVGPVTGTALGASSEVIALSVAAGLLKAVLVMIGTPFVAPLIGLNNRIGDGLWRADGHDQRRRGRPGRHRQASGALRRDDGHVLYGAGLPDGAVGHLSDAVGRHRRLRRRGVTRG